MLIKQKFFYLIIFFLSLQSLQKLSAWHIIGGNISYSCLGNNTYNIRLTVYRDCSNQQAADFDNPAYIYIFNSNTGNLYRKFGVRISNFSLIDPEANNPCIVNIPQLCIERGIYEFTTDIPPSPGGYDITYQRCCRNQTISNISNPNEVGATYTAHIPGSNVVTCNNSPVFRNLPPIVICAQNPIVFDHSATDADGDELRYELCHSLFGASSDCPQPGHQSCCSASGGCIESLPPPYNIIPFRSPYSLANPLSGTPLRIDSLTGLLTGIPARIGQFVVGICVNEYRNGVLIGSYLRDFQFNVTDCDRGIKGIIQADSVLFVDGKYLYKIKNCGSRTVNFNNISEGASKFKWNFGDPTTNADTSILKNPTYTYPSIGKYNVIMVAEPDLDCRDTMFAEIEIMPELRSDFTFPEVNCQTSNIAFTDNSYSEAGSIISWNWSFGDGTLSTLQNPTHLYSQAGTYAVTLGVTDSNQCKTGRTYFIDYYPALNVNFVVDTTSCVPLVFRAPVIEGLNSAYEIVWQFGTGDTSHAVRPVYTYLRAGNYDLKFLVNSPLGCKDSVVLNDAIKVIPTPEADYNYSPQKFTQTIREIFLESTAMDATSWQWKVNGSIISNSRNPNYTFPDTGKYDICLLVSNSFGCIDSVCKTIYVQSFFNYYLPNAFTPSSDRNNVYRGVGDFYAVKKFDMKIYNRWGEIIFQTNNINEGWNGRKNNSGSEVPAGVYVCVVNITDDKNEKYVFKNNAVVIR